MTTIISWRWLSKLMFLIQFMFPNKKARLHHVQVIKLYSIENAPCFVTTWLQWLPLGRCGSSTVQQLVSKFETIDLQRKAVLVHPRNTNQAMKQRDNPKQEISRLSLNFANSMSGFWPTPVQDPWTWELKTNDLDNVVFSLTWASKLLKGDSNFSPKIIWGNHVSFRLNEFVIRKIVMYGTILTHTRLTRWQCINKKLLFGADFEPVVLLTRSPF